MDLQQMILGWLAAVVMLAFFASATTAQAQTWIYEWDYDFATSQVAQFDGTDDWNSGCSYDNWRSDVFPGEVSPRSDEYGGTWSSNNYIANHLTQEGQGPWSDVALTADFFAFDDDALGIIVRKSAHDTFYLFLMSRHLLPATGDGSSGYTYSAGAFLFRIESGYATLVASNTTNDAMYNTNSGNYQRVRLEAVGDEVTAYYDDNSYGAWTNSQVLLTYTDNNPLPQGYVGLYAFNMGEGGWDFGFADPEVELADSDDDGTVNDDDCGPYDDTIYPGAQELCDGLDNDCDGAIDEGVSLQDYYPDADGDGYGDPNGTPVSSCVSIYGYADNDGDCDDTSNLIYPGANELCNGYDNDCDGSPAADEVDGDGDGFMVCAADCDDTNDTVHPGAPELPCDGLDNNCDGNLSSQEVDDDGDGYTDCDGDCNDNDANLSPADVDGDGDSGCDGDCDDSDPALNLADADGDSYDTCAGDCDDGDAFISPGAAEICNGIDDDCSGSPGADEVDADNDGYMVCDSDCDDYDSQTFPGAPEQCDNEDNDCDGQVDEETGDDTDGDGYNACNGDCNEGDPNIYPGAQEVCDGWDSNCDGVLPADEADADNDGWALCLGDCDDTDATLTPEDGDGDGFSSCEGDCDDEDASLTPEDADEDGLSSCDGDCDDTDANVGPDDGDGDGYSACDGDCDDTDADVSPDDVDGDGASGCDGDCDDTDPALNVDDADGDGHSTCDGDCDDEDAGNFDGNLEDCDDGVDNDCDGLVDDLDMDCGGGDDDDDNGGGDDDDTTADDDYGDVNVGGDCECHSGSRGSIGGSGMLVALLGGLLVRRKRRQSQG